MQCPTTMNDATDLGKSPVSACLAWKCAAPWGKKSCISDLWCLFLFVLHVLVTVAVTAQGVCRKFLKYCKTYPQVVNWCIFSSCHKTFTFEYTCEAQMFFLLLLFLYFFLSFFYSIFFLSFNSIYIYMYAYIVKKVYIKKTKRQNLRNWFI